MNRLSPRRQFHASRAGSRTILITTGRITIIAHTLSTVGRSGYLWAAGGGFCGTLVGNGLARFAYTPLIPALITQGWATPAQAAYLGACNLGGYFLGALGASRLAGLVGARRLVRTMMLLATLALFACAIRPAATDAAFIWLLVWRFAAGVAGAVIMVVGASLVLPYAPPDKRGLVGGIIITGVGAGVALSGTLVPLLLRAGIVGAWCGLGGLAAILTAVAWFAWPAVDLGTRRESAVEPLPRAARVLIAQYGLLAASLVPHMIFLVDFVARGLGLGLSAGSRLWVLYGLGAAAGPLLTGRLADRIGFSPALRGSLVILPVAIALPAITASGGWLVLSGVIAGGYTTGVVPLILGRLYQVLPASQHRLAWSYATICFALFQAGLAYGFSAIFAYSGQYAVIFLGGSAAALLALLLDFTPVSRRE